MARRRLGLLSRFLDVVNATHGADDSSGRKAGQDPADAPGGDASPQRSRGQTQERTTRRTEKPTGDGGQRAHD
jgi:hypothetical protein